MENGNVTNNANDNKVRSGFNFFDGLALLLIGLKLTNNLGLNWFLVLLPLLISNIVFIVQLVTFIVCIVLEIIEFFVNLFKKLFIKKNEN